MLGATSAGQAAARDGGREKQQETYHLLLFFK